MRKNILMIVMAISGIALFGGCASTTGIKGVSKLGTGYTLGKEDGAYMVFPDDVYENSIRTYSKETDYKKVLYTQLNIAAKETKRMGYNYFVITNSNVSNLNGFPINRASELLRFITLKARKPSFATNGSGRKPTNLICSGGLNIRFKPVSSEMLNNGLISVWSVSQTLQDTK